MRTPDGVQLIGFADDLMALIEAKTIQELEGKANTTLAAIVQLGSKRKLYINPNKTAAVSFTRKLNYNNPRIIVNGIDIPMVDHFRYLGVIIDRNLNWHTHIKHVTAKAIQFTNQISRISKIRWGFNSRQLKHIQSWTNLTAICLN